jgi:cyanate lyase
MKREDVTDLIVEAKVAKGLKWADIASAIGLSKEWVTAGLLGQMTFTAEQAGIIGKMLDLPADAVTQLQVVPYKGSLPTAVPTDPLIYRFYELISVYGTTFKALIHEEFGDGIMSAIDFKMDLAREAEPGGGSGEHYDEREVPAVQDVLTWPRDRHRWMPGRLILLLASWWGLTDDGLFPRRARPLFWPVFHAGARHLPY